MTLFFQRLHQHQDPDLNAHYINQAALPTYKFMLHQNYKQMMANEAHHKSKKEEHLSVCKLHY